MKTLLTFLVILIGFSCFGQVYEIELDSAEAAQLSQKRDYIKELKSIVLNYYDNLIVEKTGIQDINKAYHIFYDTVLHSKDHIEYMENIKMNQRDLDSLIVLAVDNGLFLKIWKISYSLPGSGNLSYEIAYQYEGVYSHFLKKLGKKKKVIKEYLADCEMAGEIPLSIVYGFPNIHSQFDFSNENMRLFFAMHFITSSYTQYFKKIYL